MIINAPVAFDIIKKVSVCKCYLALPTSYIKINLYFFLYTHLIAWKNCGSDTKIPKSTGLLDFYRGLKDKTKSHEFKSCI